jgi:hypothetical protein
MLLKSHKYPRLLYHSWWRIVLRDKYQEELNRQREGQSRLEDAMNRQEPIQKRDEQLQNLDSWLDQQENPKERTRRG